MRCRAVICAECCTKVDGVNHCHECLRELATRPLRVRRPNSLVTTLLVLGLTWLTLWSLFWLAQGGLAPTP
jgi:hypothetical protein